MKFHDITIQAGGIHSRRLQDTTALAPHAVEITDRLLSELRAGATRLPHGVSDLPAFDVALGLPFLDRVAALEDELPGSRATAARMVAPGRFFSCLMPGDETPFLVSLVLPAGTPPARRESDRRAIATLLGLSLGAVGGAPLEAETVAGSHAPTMQALWDARPFLASALLPTELSLDLVRAIPVAADFSTCLAASLLRSPR